MKRISAFLLGAALLAAVPFSAAAAGKTPVRILLQWLPQAQFAGYYVAEADGLYRAAGLEVELRHSSANQDSIAELVAGHCDYVSAWLAAVLLQVKSGKDIVSVGQFHQGTSLAIVARRTAGINQLEDLNGRKIVVWLSSSSRLPVCRMLDARHVKPSAILPMLSEPDLFFRGAADAIGCLMYSEYQQLIMAGFEPEELSIFRVSDVFPDLVDDGLYALRSTYDRDPAMARKIRETTREGWRRAFADPARALQLVEQRMRKANIPYPRARQKAMLDDLRPIIERPGNDGRLRRSSFDSTLSILNLDAGSIDFARFAPQAGDVK